MRFRKQARQGSHRIITRKIGAPEDVDGSAANTLKAVSNTPEMLALPPRPIPAIQINDPSDPDFGKFYFMQGLSTLGGPDVLR